MTSQSTQPERSLTLSALFDREVVVCELGGEASPEGLIGDEARAVQNASQHRLGDFAAGRACAHEAMAILGHPRSPVLVGASRAPIWPDGLVGSITHTTDLALAVVATVSTSWFGLGIDAEMIGRVDSEIESIVLDETERKALDQLDQADRATAATALFGAKEAFYKAQWPHTKSWVGFQDVTASIEDETVFLEPKSDLEALDLVQWPVKANFVVRAGIVIAGCVVSPSRSVEDP